MSAPVIYILFNRPELTRRTFGALREARPARLHLIADGPRAGHPTDATRCRETRAIVEGLLDWKCEVTRDYSEVNLGAGRRISGGLTAAFALLGEAIVLEDDILPHPDFHPFCAAQLAAHRDNPSIHSISGLQPLGRYAPADGPVVPSTFNWTWGWATWQRAWKDFRFDIAPDLADPATVARIRDYVGNDLNALWHTTNFEELLAGRVDAWDFQWNFTLLAHRRITLVSSVNLIRNLGFDADATHTVEAPPFLRDLPARPLEASARRRSLGAPNRVHDKLYGQIINTASPRRIALLRLLARYPVLAARVLKN